MENLAHGHLESDLLRTFLAVAESGSFTIAASKIYRSQSAVSLQIKRLEELLGCAVFQRDRSGVKLTSTGEKLRTVALTVTNILDATFSEIRPGTLSGKLKIAIPDEFGETILPKIISQFSREHPNVELSVQCGMSSHFLESFKSGEIDIAVLDSQEMFGNSILLKKKKRFWARSKFHNIHKLNPIPIALFDGDCWWRDHATEALNEHNINYRIVYSSESVSGVIAAIEAGIAVGLLSDDALGNSLVSLGEADGFPNMPDSLLLMCCRLGMEAQIANSMTSAICAEFQNS